METKKHRDIEPLLNVPELARALNVDTTWVYRQVRLKKIKHIKLMKYLRFRLSDVLQGFEH